MNAITLHRTSQDIQADIQALKERLANETQALQDIEKDQGSDYQSLLSATGSDTEVIGGIAKAQVQVRILERGLAAAQADLAAAETRELQERRKIVRNDLAKDIEAARKVAKEVQKNLDGMCTALLELVDKQKEIANRLTLASRELLAPRDSVLILESRSALLNEDIMRNQVMWAIYRRCKFIRPDHVAPGVVFPFDDLADRTFRQVGNDMDDLLGLTPDGETTSTEEV